MSNPDDPSMGDVPSPESFDAALAARYQRLSLLTLNLAEEAGEAAVNFSLVEKANRAGPFERRVAAMSRAIWAHRVVERLRALHDRKMRGAARIDEGRRPGVPQVSRFDVCPPDARKPEARPFDRPGNADGAIAPLMDPADPFDRFAARENIEIDEDVDALTSGPAIDHDLEKLMALLAGGDLADAAIEREISEPGGADGRGPGAIGPRSRDSSSQDASPQNDSSGEVLPDPNGATENAGLTNGARCAVPASQNPPKRVNAADRSARSDPLAAGPSRSPP